MSLFSPGAVDAILFDLDGTLIDSRADLAAAVNAARHAIGKGAVPETLVVDAIGDGMTALLQRTLGPVSPEQFSAAKTAFLRHYDAHCVERTAAYPGVAAVLAGLSRSCKIGVVTNKPRGFTDRILIALGLAPFVGAVVGGDTLPEKKPDPAPVRHALTLLQADPRRSVMVGDGVQDILAGQAAGLATIAVRYGYGFSPKAEALQPTRVVESFTDLSTLFQEKEIRT